MKTKMESFKYQLATLFFLLFNTTMALAQGGGTGQSDDAGANVTVSKSTTSSTTTTQDWYTQPWVWVVGGLIFILLLIALMRGGSSRTDVHRTTIRKDVSTD